MPTQKKDKVLQDYIGAAIAHGEATKEGDYKTANKQYGNLVKIYKKLEKDHLFADSIFEMLFRHENASVRIWAAAHALKLNIRTDEAENVLKKASEDHNIGILRLDSEMTLKEWNKRKI